MTSLKTIAATAVIAVGGTVAAFSGLHIGQAPADAAAGTQQAKAQPKYTVTLTAKDLTQLAAMMGGRQAQASGPRTSQHRQQSHHRHQARRVSRTTRQASYAASRSYSSSRSTSRGSGYRCWSHSGGSWGGSSHHGGGCRW